MLCFRVFRLLPFFFLLVNVLHYLTVYQMVICGSFYPNYFMSGEIDEREALKTMSGHDPFTTVMVCACPVETIL